MAPKIVVNSVQKNLERPAPDRVVVVAAIRSGVMLVALVLLLTWTQ